MRLSDRRGSDRKDHKRLYREVYVSVSRAAAAACRAVEEVQEGGRDGATYAAVLP